MYKPSRIYITAYPYCSSFVNTFYSTGALASHLGLDRPFYGLQAPGLDGEQPPLAKIEDIAAAYVAAIQTIQPHGPYLLGGHCFGGRVALEMSLQLQKQGQEVALLAIFDIPVPLPPKEPIKVDIDDARLLAGIAMDFETLFGKELSVTYEILQTLEPEEQFNYLLNKLKMFNIFPPNTGLQQLHGLLQVYKANIQATVEYSPQGMLTNHVTVFRAIDRHGQEGDEFADQPTLGWDRLSAQQVETYDVPGDHITMFADPHVKVLAQKLRVCLDQVQAND